MSVTVFARGDDRLPMLTVPVDPTPLLHRWYNADRASRGIATIDCAVRDGELYVHVVAAGPDGTIDWGKAPATAFADLSITGGARSMAEPLADGVPTPHYADVTTTEAGPAFTARYDHDFQQVLLQGRINLGLLVVAFFTEFLDGSSRANYIHREVFAHHGDDAARR